MVFKYCLRALQYNDLHCTQLIPAAQDGQILLEKLKEMALISW